MRAHLLPVDCSDESNGELIEVEHTKVSHPQRQLPPRLRSVLKHETVEKRKREGGRGEERLREWEKRVREEREGREREMEGEQKRNGRRGIECENGRGNEGDRGGTKRRVRGEG